MNKLVTDEIKVKLTCISRQNKVFEPLIISQEGNPIGIRTSDILPRNLSTLKTITIYKKFAINFTLFIKFFPSK
jgi:hypothetical protein